jgi:hypothetical protein
LLLAGRSIKKEGNRPKNQPFKRNSKKTKKALDTSPNFPYHLTVKKLNPEHADLYEEKDV